ncbi:hypothetical protein J2Y38_002165 [Flavobacterium sp. 2755]|uniref:carboxypeptidase-like regulatory domain-containing protein n=1 Tax=Flavobacterium sp. 2755 TaxID=2817765 RepID=UPI0028570451|nr:carboxypeptidase-like regulatory domain-containing protein [Flavobacterium sp. 2755]MDR6761954.1 hypothetical protein [Flavobacterium sp. 2755]
MNRGQFFLISILLLSQIMFSQKNIHGKVIDLKTKEILAFVNIGIPNENIGTVSDEKGRFNLKLNDTISFKKEVFFSYIGYKTKAVSLASLESSGEAVIELERDVNELKEVVVNLKMPKEKKIGRTTKGLGLMHANFYSFYEKNVEDRLSKEMGMKMKIKKDCSIEGLNFNITSNEFKSLKFRLNIYSVKNNLPHDLLLKKDIIFEIKNGFLGWYNVNLKNEDIFIGKENEEIAVTIQWIASEKMNDSSKFFSISTAASPGAISYYREKGFDSWKKGSSNLSFYLNAMCN